MYANTMTDIESMKSRFYDRIYNLVAVKNKNNQLFTFEQYNRMVVKVKESKAKFTQKTPEDFQRLARYDIIKIENFERLIVPFKNNTKSVIFYTYLEETFQIIHEIHVSIGHGGRTKMIKELKTKYKNITVEIVMVYLSLCEVCRKKFSAMKKGPVSYKAVLTSQLDSRCQIDLIDMQLQADGDFKYIMLYQDYLTKFVQLRALKTNEAAEIADILINIFTIFGAPNILQSDSGQEFSMKIVEEACNLWDELKIVPSNGSVKRNNQDIEKMLYIWMQANNTTKWSDGLRFVQLMKNRTYHSILRRSPFEAMFGRKVKVGLKASLPHDVLSDVLSEENLERFIQNQGDSNQCQNLSSDEDNFDTQFEMKDEFATITNFLDYSSPNSIRFKRENVEDSDKHPEIKNENIEISIGCPITNKQDNSPNVLNIKCEKVEESENLMECFPEKQSTIHAEQCNKRLKNNDVKDDTKKQYYLTDNQETCQNEDALNESPESSSSFESSNATFPVFPAKLVENGESRTTSMTISPNSSEFIMPRIITTNTYEHVVPTSTNPTPSTSVSGNQKRSRNNENDMEYLLKKRCLQIERSTDDGSDAMDLFFRAIALSAKSLPGEKQYEFLIKTLDLFRSVKYGDSNNSKE